MDDLLAGLARSHASHAPADSGNFGARIIGGEAVEGDHEGGPAVAVVDRRLDIAERIDRVRFQHELRHHHLIDDLPRRGLVDGHVVETLVADADAKAMLAREIDAVEHRVALIRARRRIEFAQPRIDFAGGRPDEEGAAELRDQGQVEQA
jgi:hypothetical protein